MKKRIVTLLMVLSVASLCACGNTETTTSDAGTTDATVDETGVADTNASLPDPTQALAKALEDGDVDTALSYAIETGNAEVANALSNGDLEKAREIFNGGTQTTEEADTTADDTDTNANGADYNYVTSEYVSFVDLKTPEEQLEYLSSVAVEHNLEFVADENLDELTVTVVNASETVTATLHEEEKNGDVVVVLSEDNGYSVTFTTLTGNYSLKSLVSASGTEIDSDVLYEKKFSSGDDWSGTSNMRITGTDTDATCTITCK